MAGWSTTGAGPVLSSLSWTLVVRFCGTSFLGGFALKLEVVYYVLKKKNFDLLLVIPVRIHKNLKQLHIRCTPKAEYRKKEANVQCEKEEKWGWGQPQNFRSKVEKSSYFMGRKTPLTSSLPSKFHPE